MATEYKLSYTASEIDSKLGQISALAKKSEVPTKVSDLTNDSGFTTESYVDSAIAAIPSPDMSSKQDKITGTTGQFVVIGEDGNVTTMTIQLAEGVTFGV